MIYTWISFCWMPWEELKNVIQRMKEPSSGSAYSPFPPFQFSVKTVVLLFLFVILWISSNHEELSSKFHRFHVSRWKVLLSRVAKKIRYRLFLLLFCLKQHLNCVFQSSALSPDLLGFVTGRRDEESQPNGGKKVRKTKKKSEKSRKRTKKSGKEKKKSETKCRYEDR